MALKLKNKYEYQSPTVRRILAEGEVRGKRETLEVLLRARGFHTGEALRDRLQECDATELDALVVRATNIESLDELFES